MPRKQKPMGRPRKPTTNPDLADRRKRWREASARYYWENHEKVLKKIRKTEPIRRRRKKK